VVLCGKKNTYIRIFGENLLKNIKNNFFLPIPTILIDFGGRLYTLSTNYRKITKTQARRIAVSVNQDDISIQFRHKFAGNRLFLWNLGQNYDDLAIILYFGRKMRNVRKILQILVKIRCLELSKILWNALIILLDLNDVVSCTSLGGINIRMLGFVIQVIIYILRSDQERLREMQHKVLW
jgi:hypothetical protein